MGWAQGLDWEQGEPKQSLKQDILDIFEANPDTIIDISELRGILFPEVSYSSDDEADMENQALLLATARIHTLVEILVNESRVEKRVFEVDFAEQVSMNEDEYEEIAGALEGEVDTEMELYKLSQ